ncbi:electron transfer flavoprotein subunit beta/FixA family protein [Candidatus Aminicenantes bacterium AC-335-A11]|nr:electron transfer flavoprotein subunit beta/FixA family protein [SCandidatus Aminicenantes bacterium Aminicenantia_JdfR_composite]MCP2597345.1 electron transfer flavoprotein subunit beta/FixA family protein [Candidatus Aminicenantes bacterium AC-335-G13]MCP2598115.1 electron transfer flavoprotein subunit beta/FixA family protein [Candidatus Aminicenantes bacterium AC-335-L06]MCP2618040.1 electron transfer flavoprotein subunit beta/FixA family protein [Candidatus Aminicenantes bacterium AC-335
MNIIVFVKQVPDTESKIRISSDRKSIIEEDLNFVLNPYDEFAVEEALRIKENKGGKVTVISVGPERAITALRKCLAMGADEAFLIKDEEKELYEPYRIAKIVAKALKNKFKEFDILLFGKQSVGADNSAVPSMVAGMLNLPQVNVVTKLVIENGRGWAHREIEGALEEVEFNLPAVISAQKGLNEPRYETLKGIMAAKRKEIPLISFEDIGITEEELKPLIEIEQIEPPPPRPSGKILTGPPEETARKLVELLRNEAKVI